MSRKVLVTNNPSVEEVFSKKYPDLRCEIEYHDCSFEELLNLVRDLVHRGWLILTHPLDGSVKPMETPYKSILVEERTGELDTNSLMLIENAIQATEKFKAYYRVHPEEALKDLRTIDRTLIESALDTAHLTGY